MNVMYVNDAILAVILYFSDTYFYFIPLAFSDGFNILQIKLNER